MYTIYWLSTLVFLITGFAKQHNQSKSEYIPGTDITDQLRDDLMAGLDVSLPEGHFYTSETIIATGYSGSIEGAGTDATIIEASKGFRASSDTLFKPEYELSEMFAIYLLKGDLTIKDFTILVKGDAPAELHTNPFHGPATTIDNGIVVAGTHEDAVKEITVRFKNLRIIGKDSNDPGSVNGKNLAYPLIASGAYGVPLPFNVIIKNCVIESAFRAIECYDLYGGTGIIKNNSFQKCNRGIAAGSFFDPLKTLGKLYIMENSFTNMKIYSIKNLGKWSDYCFRKNTEDGEPIPDDCR